MTTTIGSLDLNAFSDLYSDSTQYFWFESDATATYGAGAHITLVPDTSFISNPTGQNILMNTDGFSIRNGLLPMMTLDNNSLDFNVVDTTAGTSTITATFTATGAQIGQSGAAHSVIDAKGQRFYATDGTTQLANIGYGDGVNTTGGVSVAPSYTFGVRKTTINAYNPFSTYAVGDVCVYDEKVYVCIHAITTPESWDASHWQYYIGNYSVAEGLNTIASGVYSHAEGSDTTASGNYSHAEGVRTIASGNYSHAEGMNTRASGVYSHAEGSDTTASGNYSHAEGWGTIASGSNSHSQNRMTIAAKSSQTALGTYNIEDASDTTTHPSGTTSYGQYAVIVGNGTSSDARSNALTVDWNGNITINNHDSEIGHVYSASTSVAISNTAIANNTDGASLTLSAGVYIVIGQWHFDTRTTTGTTNSAIRLYRSGSSANIAQTRVMAGDSNWNSLQCMAIVTLTSTETVKVCGATSRPYTTAQGTYINAIRIK